MQRKGMTLRTTLPFVLSLLCVSPGLLAQKTPAVELFGGYSYLRTHTFSGGGDYNLNGWQASLTNNMNRWLGLEADFNNHYGTAPPAFVDRSPRFSYLFGPRFTFRMLPGVTPFAHALFGAVRGTAVVETSGPVCPPVGVPYCVTLTRPQTAFGMAYGGGLDLKVTRGMWLRLFQADYMTSNFTNDGRNDLRVSAGIVLRFGRK